MRALFAAAVLAMTPVAVSAQPVGAAAQPPFDRLYGFCQTGYGDCADGADPDSILLGANGVIYGTTDFGGANYLADRSVYGPGVVFSLTPTEAGYTQRVLYSFCARGGARCTDGYGPMGPLAADASGNFYGITLDGGAHGGGTVFQLSPVKGQRTYRETVLYSFCDGTECPQGKQPYGGLYMDAKKRLFGVTQEGGSHGVGTVYLLAPTAKPDVYAPPKILLSFCGSAASCSAGEFPNAPIVADAEGNLFLTSSSGNGMSGSILELTAKGGDAYEPKVLTRFCRLKDCADGEHPEGPLFMDAERNLFGTTILGGRHKFGTVFELPYDKSKAAYAAAVTVLHDFCSTGGTQCIDGDEPYGGVVKVGDKLYGATIGGGAYGFGDAFAIDTTGTHDLSILHSFCKTYSSGRCADGLAAEWGLVADNKGDLYGVTATGGPYGNVSLGGTVFRLTP